MRLSMVWRLFLALCLAMPLTPIRAKIVHSQETAAATDASATEETSASSDSSAPEPLTDDELEVLVARIALYPDELIAVISGASLYPLQIVEAARFLDKYEKDNSLKPDEDWDGSVISLLNYPEILRMMSDDLAWTQELGEALAYQQKDVLVAIQQLRDEAIANGIIGTDDKMEVVEEDDNVVIRSTSTETVYVPQYEPEMLYVANYPPTPIAYYPTPYPHYYYPGATFFAGFVTGAIWAGVVDWGNWGVWGGRYSGNDINIDCNNCFNNREFNGKVNLGDVDLRNIDRSKVKFDKNQFANLDRKDIRNNIKDRPNNNIRDKAQSIKKERPSNLPANKGGSRDVRKSMQEGLKKRPATGAQNRPNVSRPSTADRPKAQRPANKGTASKKRPSNKKAGAKADRRPKKPTSLGNVSKGKRQKVASKRGSKSMGGGSRKAGGHKSVKRKGGGKRRGGGGRRR